MWTALAKLNPICSPFFFFEKKKRAGFIILFGSLLYLPFWGGDLRCGADILISFFFYLFLFFSYFFSKDGRVLLLWRLLPQVLTYLDLLLREYGRGLFDSDNEMGDGSIVMQKVYIPMHEF